MKEKIEAIKNYLKYFPNDYNATNNLTLCQYADELGIELDRKSYYPKMDSGFFRINSQIQAGKKYYLVNSETQYRQNGFDTIIIWHESCGRLAFVDDKYWFTIEDEWKEFMQTILSYNPLDWDGLNNVYIFDVENGKRLIEDYKQILNEFMDKCHVRIKQYQLEQKRKELERLQKELEAESNV
jgi:hypothetical protein